MLGVSILRSASDAQMLACANPVHLQTTLELMSDFLARYAVVLQPHCCLAALYSYVYIAACVSL